MTNRRRIATMSIRVSHFRDIALVAFFMLLVTGAAADESLLQAAWRHETMATRIGEPAIVSTSALMPALEVTVGEDGLLEVAVRRDGETELERRLELLAGEEARIELASDGASEGWYKARLAFRSNGGAETIHDQLHFTVLDEDAFPDGQSRVVREGPDGTLRYAPDYRGNRIPDFSHAGYAGGGVPLPEAPVGAVVQPGEGDDTERIQAAIDQVSERSPDADGIRGAVFLEAGVYEVEGSLRIRHSGVVLRGAGPGPSRAGERPAPPGPADALKEQLKDKDATILLATGEERRILIRIAGTEGRELSSNRHPITDVHAPVGSRTLHVADASALSEGDGVIIRRYGNEDWISEIGMDDIPSRPGGESSPAWEPFHLDIDRVITGVDGDCITLDAPLPNAIEQRWGGGEIIPYDDHRIEQVGIEGMRAISVWEPNEDGVDDTRHADRFCNFDNVTNAWVRDVIVEHFFGTNGAISTGYGAKWLTLKDNEILVAGNEYYSGPGYSARVFGETGVYTGRYGYRLQGQLTLARDSYAIHSRHGFTVGRHAAGPNVFLFCEGERPVTTSQPHFRWSVGGLYDNVEDEIAIQNRLWYGTSHGWAGANYVAWNTRGSLIAQRPPTAQNWAIGHVGEKGRGAHADIIPDLQQGYWESHGEHVEPASLYLRQLEDRLGTSDPP